jgi:hypothetical protein
MMRKAFAVWTLLLPALALTLVGPSGAVAATPAGGTVYVAGGLSDDDLTVLSVAIAASDPSAVLLLDSPDTTAANKAFLTACEPTELVAVGAFPQGVEDLEKRLGRKNAVVIDWKAGQPTALWKRLFPNPQRVVVCTAKPRGQFLQAACLAGACRAPLIVLRNEKEAADPENLLPGWRPREVIAVGSAVDRVGKLPEGVRLTRLADEEATAAACLNEHRGNAPALIVANATDVEQGAGNMSALAPYIAVRKASPLLLTEPKGENVEAVVAGAVKKPQLVRADAVILVAGLKAIPTEKRPNPAPGKDKEIEMEPLTPKDNAAFSFAVGRMFHDDPAVVLLMLARPRLLEASAKAGKPRRALVASNPGGGLPLLETFSRHTTHELKNAGYQTTALFENNVEKDVVRRTVAQVDIFLWEGHYRTLTDDFGFLTWDEPLPPSLIVLQSCLALKEDEGGPGVRAMLGRGAVAAVGSATRTYSGTGGAFTLAFFDAMIYDDRTLGGGLRQSKNYLLCYSLLKEKRLGEKAKLTGVNVRSAWAFTLWGDPTLKLPHPQRPENALDPIKHEVRGSTLIVTLPDTTFDKVAVGKYEAQMRPNGRLAGLLTMNAEDEDIRNLVPFVFAEVSLPKAPPGKMPKLTSRLGDRNWVFVWDARRQVGYLLMTPRNKEQREVRFTITWEDPQ